MTSSRPRPLVAGNWKMNGMRAALAEIKAIAEGYDVALQNRAALLICTPATLVLSASAACLGSKLEIGGQDCHAKASGAHTGDISAEMLADCGASYVIVGHSERRADHGETSEIVKAKAEAALRAGLRAIVCVGETLPERDEGRVMEVIGRQLEAVREVLGGAAMGEIVLAYEPVWAIGTGRSASVAQVAEVHAAIRAWLKAHGVAGGVRILYGGSVKPDNAAAIFAVADVDGGLIGGASLAAADFMAICRAAAGGV